ncbi:hypothetical protein R3P38DRAFT_2814568 [Favolaschia claudopus]|uniref:Uncharacterized protein n=1 Tax=Favolaschia claudopus TaxID=2862362 RepID=A0AAV9Z315_9AGAR
MIVHPSSPIQTLQFEPTTKAIGAQLTPLSEFRFFAYDFRSRPYSKSTRPVRAFAVTLPWFSVAGSSRDLCQSPRIPQSAGIWGVFEMIRPEFPPTLSISPRIPLFSGPVGRNSAQNSRPLKANTLARYETLVLLIAAQTDVVAAIQVGLVRGRFVEIKTARQAIAAVTQGGLVGRALRMCSTGSDWVDWLLSGSVVYGTW